MATLFFIITESLVPAEMQNQSEVMYAVNQVNHVLNQLPLPTAITGMCTCYKTA